MIKVVEILGAASSVLLLKLFIDRFLWRKDNLFPIGISIYIGGFIAFLAIANLYSSVVLKATIVILGTVGLCRLFYSASWLQAAFISFSYEVIAAAIEIIEMGIISLTGINPKLLMQDEPMRAFYIVTTQITVLVFVVLSGIFSEKKNRILKWQWIVPLIPCQLLSAIVCYTSLLYSRFDAYDIILLIVLLYINIAFVYYVEMICKIEDKQKRAELAEQQYQMQKEYYHRLHENQEETRALWHDIQKYILAMQAVSNAQNNHSIKSIIQQAEETLQNIELVVDVNNLVVSSILNSYLTIAKKENIKVDIDVQIPPVLTISPVDLSIILGNTMENAIEACHILSPNERWIKIKLYLHNQTLFYRIRNPYNKEETFHLRGKYHGYGLNNIKQCVSHYDGDLQITQQENIFEVNVRMNC